MSVRSERIRAALEIARHRGDSEDELRRLLALLLDSYNHVTVAAPRFPEYIAFDVRFSTADDDEVLDTFIIDALTKSNQYDQKYATLVKAGNDEEYVRRTLGTYGHWKNRTSRAALQGRCSDFNITDEYVTMLRAADVFEVSNNLKGGQEAAENGLEHPFSGKKYCIKEGIHLIDYRLNGEMVSLKMSAKHNVQIWHIKESRFVPTDVVMVYDVTRTKV
ncbi:MAG: hypothetical protein ABF868_03060 [Sporolactobacillus sp.]